MVAHRPALTAAHIDLGLMNYGGAIYTAPRGRYPIMMTLVSRRIRTAAPAMATATSRLAR
ncbi:MAG: hypothetical protein ACHQ7M_03545 [Chloroflexota bacterium]